MKKISEKVMPACTNLTLTMQNIMKAGKTMSYFSLRNGLKWVAYDKSDTQRIINHEDIMLETYSKIISNYSSLFEQYGCSLEVSLFWTNLSTEERSNSRLPFRIGYECYVCCEVQKDGKEVNIKSTDGEAEYYSLSAAWAVSSIERKFFKTIVFLYSDTCDIENDIREMLRLLSDSR